MNFNAVEDVSRSVGRHLLIDGFCDETEPLADPTRIEGLFRRLVRTLDMEILVPPVTKEVPLQPEKLATGSDEGGITSFCVITTSHMSIHTWPLRRFFSMDVYSCKDFDPDAAIAVIRETLGVVALNVKNVVRRAPEPVDAAVVVN
jgi:S-adenosylmethionine decarboxylase